MHIGSLKRKCRQTLQWLNGTPGRNVFIYDLLWFAMKCIVEVNRMPAALDHKRELKSVGRIREIRIVKWFECDDRELFAFEWFSMSCWLRPHESVPEIVQGPGGVTKSPTLLGPSWCEASRTVRDCCWLWGISSRPRAAAPAALPGGKADMKMNDFPSIFSQTAYQRCGVLLCFPTLS